MRGGSRGVGEGEKGGKGVLITGGKQGKDKNTYIMKASEVLKNHQFASILHP